MEIERKFFIPELPENWAEYPFSQIEQAYISRDPVIRVRRRDDQYILTVKGSGVLVREEHELPLSAEAYQRLKEKAEGNVIRKRRVLIPCGPYTIEMDLFEEPFDDLVMAEVEFPSVEEAMAFTPPEWFGEDVTENPRFHNSNMTRTKYAGHSFFAPEETGQP